MPTVGTPLVELFLASVWTDITTFVRVQDRITITRGVQDEQSSPQTATCHLVLNNLDGRFSPRNASGAYFGNIGRNTQIRVSVYDDHAVAKVRFWGFVSEWPVSADLSLDDITCSVVANGYRRRLAQGSTLLNPAYQRAILMVPNLLAYWPMTDGAQATQFGSGLPGGGPAFFSTTGTTLAANTDFLSGGALPTFTDGSSTAFPVPAYTPAASGQQVRMLLENDGAGGGFILRFDTNGAHFFLLEHSTATSQITMAMYNYNTGVQEYTSGALGGVNWSLPSRVSVDFRQNGTGIDWTVNWYNVGASLGLFFNGTVASSTFGRLTQFGTVNDLTGDTAVLGHVSVENNITTMFDIIGAINAFSGETAAARTIRLAAEQGVTRVGYGGPVISQALGAQLPNGFLDLWDEAAFVEGGVSTEEVDTLALTFRSRSSMYDLAAGAFVSLAKTDLNDMVATDDDLVTANDVTVQRVGGASYRVTQTSGNLAVAAVGTYATQFDLSLAADSQAQDQAGWRLTLGTVDAPRWPTVGFDARVLTLAQRDLLIAQREGDLLQLTAMPVSFGGGGTISLRVLGWTEVIGVTDWQFRVNASPDEVLFNSVFILDSATFGILDTDRLGL